jgi:ATP-binding cassette subfamily F protein 3
MVSIVSLAGSVARDMAVTICRRTVPARHQIVSPYAVRTMAVLIASNLRKEFTGSPLFDGVSFTLNRRDRLALAGPNGAGKTTLLRAIVGETSLQGGELAFAKGTRVALHDQRPPRDRDVSLREYVLSGAADLVAIEDDLRRLELAMAGGDHSPRTLRRYADAQARLEHAGGWAWRERAASALRGLGFRDPDLDRSLDTFSGGELTRASLARALAGDPDLLLLDEPTNHLDVDSLEWLENELTSLDAAIVIVAHDRWFLEAVTTAVLELDGGRSFFFAGPWHAWRLERAARASAAAKTAERIGEDIERLERFVARFRYKKSKAKQAQAKLTQIGRLEKERRKATTELDNLTRRRRTMGFEFLKPARTGRVVLDAEHVELAAGDKPLLHDAQIVLERGEHVALVGPNGSGKTTLLETLLGNRSADSGSIRLGHGVEPAYFSQHEVELDERGTVLECATSMTGLTRPQAQALLGRFLFSGWDEHEKQVTALSGGERRRLALAVVVASGANLLVLDEPTNHLDLESREALEAALDAFPGTVLLVSHDRALLDAVADRTVAIEDGSLHSYDGGWADLVRTRSEAREPTAAIAEPPPERKPKSAKPKPERRRPSDLERSENRVAELERRVASFEAKLAEDWTDMDVLTAHRAARDELRAELSRWEELFAAAQQETPTSG